MYVSQKIENHFTQGVRGVTPIEFCSDAKALYIPVTNDPDFTRLCASVLSPEELSRARKFSDPIDRVTFIERRAFRRYCGKRAANSFQDLPEVRFETDQRGRPFLPDTPGIWFSFSACRTGLLGAWSSTHGVGVDLEDTHRQLAASDLAHHFFSKNEASLVSARGTDDNRQVFYRLWCLKEAALKSIGVGLSFGLDAFEFELKAVPRVIKAPREHGRKAHYRAQFLAGTGHCASMVTRKSRSLCSGSIP